MIILTRMIPKRSRRWPKRNVETFFNSWSPNMAYILGYFASDGCMYQNKRGSCYISFTSTDIELIELVKQLMGVSNRVERYQSPKKTWKIRYVLQIGSKKLYERLLRIGFTSNKSLTLIFPEVPDEMLAHFLRYFDGDGCATFNDRLRKDRNNMIYSNLLIRFTCGNQNFLKTIQTKLKFALGIQGSLFPHGATAYDLAYSTQDVIKLYSFLYPNAGVPCLRRKQVILSRGIQEKYSKGS